MKVLVTGGAGFIGSHIVEQLLEHQHEVVALDNLATGDRCNLPAGARLVVQDVVSDLDPLFAQEGFDAVIHQAAQVSVQFSIRNPLHDLRVNLEGLVRLLEACRNHRVGKIIFASSAAVYGKPLRLPVPEEHPLVPLSPYGLTKKTAEEYLRIYSELYGIEYTILRYSNVYGPRQSVKGESGVIAIFTETLCKGGVPTINGDGSDTRDYVYVEDVAKANVLALTGGEGRIFNVSTANAVNLNQLFSALTGVLGSRVEPRYGPARPGDIRHSTLANEKIRGVLGWNPQTELREGLQKTVEWFRRHGRSGEK